MTTTGSMRLRLMVPTHELIDFAIRKLVARGIDGAFCLLPRHIDFVSALVPGILVVTPVSGAARYVAIDEGLLVKIGDDVLVSVAHAMVGDDLAELRSALDARRNAIDEESRRARTALARLEARALRGVFDLERGAHV